MRWASWGIVAASIALGACEGTDGRDRPATDSPGPEDDGVTRVAVQNLYVGTDLARLLEIRSPAEISQVVAREFASIDRSYFPERARALALAIAHDPPHLIGLQEVSVFRVQRPGDFASGNAREATDTVLDFLAILLDELDMEGIAYRPVATYTGMDIELPSVNTAGGIDDIRLTDRGVILARSDVTTDHPRSVSFASNLTVTVGGEEGFDVELVGGWAAVEATVGGGPVLFVTTHLESADLAPEVNAEQARELLTALDTVTRPIVMVGDFSSTADGEMTSAYEAIAAAGFIDVWDAARPGDPGLTCCQAPDLRNTVSALDRRLDFVFYRDSTTRRGEVSARAFEARLLVVARESRTPSGLWPSDHAGVSAIIRPNLKP